jgi:hypothetical protein
MEEKLIRRARVILVKGKTHKIGGVKYIRNVPKIVKGSLCDEFKANGYFSCEELESKVVKKKKDKKKKKSSSSVDGGSSKKSKSGKKAKDSSKKKTSK